MKAKRIIFGFGLLVALGILLSSCTKVSSNGETIVPIGKEYFDVEELFSEVKPSFDEVKGIMGIGDEDLIPPKLDNLYHMNRMRLIGSNYNEAPPSISDIEMRFDCQHNCIVNIEFTESSITQKIDSVYVIGNNDSFSIYFVEEKNYSIMNYHVRLKRGIIMSGSIAQDALSDFRLAFIVINWEDDSNGALHSYNPGTYMVYEEEN